MQATIIKIARNPARPSAPDEYPGWIVPETEGLLAIDLRCPASIEFVEAADWAITHIPTGHRVIRYPYTNASTRERAVEIAQNFYRECRSRGWDIVSSDPMAIPGMHNAMAHEHKIKFWEAVAGSPPKPEASAHV